MFYVDFFLQAYPFTIGLFVLLVVEQVLFSYMDNKQSSNKLVGIFPLTKAKPER